MVRTVSLKADFAGPEGRADDEILRRRFKKNESINGCLAASSRSYMVGPM
jgi:hypothetical protein